MRLSNKCTSRPLFRNYRVTWNINVPCRTSIFPYFTLGRVLYAPTAIHVRLRTKESWLSVRLFESSRGGCVKVSVGMTRTDDRVWPFYASSMTISTCHLTDESKTKPTVPNGTANPVILRFLEFPWCIYSYADKFQSPRIPTSRRLERNCISINDDVRIVRLNGIIAYFVQLGRNTDKRNCRC